MQVFKWILFLKQSEEKLIAYESWTVRWTSYDNSISLAYFKEQAEVFTTKQDAETFAESLKAARKLLKDSSLKYSIEKN